MTEAFAKFKSVQYKRLQRSFADSEFASWGIVDENGNLTNAGALLADESPRSSQREHTDSCRIRNGILQMNCKYLFAHPFFPSPHPVSDGVVCLRKFY